VAVVAFMAPASGENPGNHVGLLCSYAVVQLIIPLLKII